MKEFSLETKAQKKELLCGPPSLVTASTKRSWRSGVQRKRGLGSRVITTPFSYPLSIVASITHSSCFLLPPSSFFQFQHSDFRGGQKSNSLVWHSTAENKWRTHQNILYTRPSPHTCRGKIGDESEETCHMKEINIYVEREMTTPLHVYLLFRSPPFDSLCSVLCFFIIRPRWIKI